MIAKALPSRQSKILAAVICFVIACGSVCRAEPSSVTAASSPQTSTFWQTLAVDPYPGKRDDISFADALHGWYGTGKGDLYRTDDAGLHWTKIASRPGTFIRSLGFVDAKTGFIGNVGVGYYPGVTDATPLYRTDDGGVTWTPADLGGKTIAGVCAIDILRTHRIYQGELRPRTMITAAGRVGGPAGLLRSDDGGDTWRVIDLADRAGMVLDVHFFDEQTGVIAASTGRDIATTQALILRTVDGGATWSEVYRSARPGELVWKVSFPTDKIGYGTVMSYDTTNLSKIIVKTDDGGKTWREMPLVKDGAAVELGIGFIDDKHGFVGTTIGGFETRDGGKTFTKALLAKAVNKFRIVGKGRAGYIYAIGKELQRARTL